MTINAILATPDKRQPVFLVKFTYGDQVWGYTTSRDKDYTVVGVTYVRIPISVGKLAGSVSESVNEGEITLPSDNPVIAIFDAFLPVEPVMCQIYYLEANDPDQEVRLVKSGKVTTIVDADDETSKIKIRPNQEAFSRAIPWQPEQVNCPLVLYGVQCGVSPAPYLQTATTLSAMTGSYIQSGSFTNADPTYFKAGYVKCRRTREIRFIVNQDNSTGKLYISYPFEGATVSDIFDAYAGCMKTGDICQNKFNNKINFMGFEFIPTKNMFRTGIK